jgi:UDP-glucose 4-epimerase
MKSLVTGGAGFLGSHVVDELIKMGHEVVILDDLSGGFIENVNPHAEFINGSICDSILIESLFNQKQFDFVFHLAAYAAEGLSHFIKSFNYQNNLIGSVNLINASINSGSVKCFVFTSSIAVYGHIDVIAEESQTPRPIDPYGIAKFCVEQELASTYQMFGLPYIVFRPHNIYGERQNMSDPYRNVLGIFLNQALNGDPFTIFGDGTQTRSFSYIQDVAPYIARSIGFADAYQQVFNIGGDTPHSVNELADAISQAANIEDRRIYLPHRNEVTDAHASHAKFCATFGEPSTSTDLKSGVKQMLAWAATRKTAKPALFKGIEVTKNMPPSWLAL